MDTLLEIVLAPEVISAVLIMVSLLMAGRVVIQFSGEATALRGRLVSVDTRLETLRAELPAKRTRVAALAVVVNERRPIEQRLRQYSDVLAEINIQVERQEQEREEQEKIKSERDKARRDIGL